MKKILFMAMAAVVLMACGDGNGASVPSKDKTAVIAASADAVELIGAEPAAVDKKLTAAGYTKMDMPASLEAPKLNKKAIKQIPALKAEDDAEEVLYVYNLPEESKNWGEEEFLAYQNKLMKDGKVIAYAIVSFQEGKMTMMVTEMVVGYSAKANLLYTEISNKLYAQLPEKEKALQIRWQGAVSTPDAEQQQFEVQADYVKAIEAANNGVQAQEMGYAILNSDYDGTAYQGGWYAPGTEDTQAMEKEGVTPYASGYMMVADLKAIM